MIIQNLYTHEKIEPANLLPPVSENRRVSVVMATLGGVTVARTIAALNCGTLIPEEILICIPEEFKCRVEKLLYPNVRVVATLCRGQVVQRAIGFQQASYDLVLQLDDDIEVRHDCLEKLVDCILEVNNIAVAPKMLDASTGQYHASLTPEFHTNPLFRQLMFWIVNGSEGYMPGKIGRAGIGMGLPEQPDDWFDIGWLPGGCVLHRKKNLVLFNNYLLKEKAFAEDLFHSALLRRKGIRLVRCGRAICDVEFSPDVASGILDILKGYRAYAIALRQFIKENGGVPVFLYLYLIFNLSGIVIRKLSILIRHRIDVVRKA